LPTVLFVCTGNICRSPMAEYLARELEQEDEISFVSAGTSTHSRIEPSEGTRHVMDQLGIDLRSHRSQSVWEIGADADVIYALSREHLDAMTARWPDRADAIHLLRIDESSIADPYGLDLDSYRSARDEIAAAVRERAARGWDEGAEMTRAPGRRLIEGCGHSVSRDCDGPLEDCSAPSSIAPADRDR
jgi:protein-tyrosine-phosphatase